MMRAILAMAGLLILAGCAGGSYVAPTACSSDPGGQACQVDRYINTQ
jgi:hypothetical protein